MAKLHGRTVIVQDNNIEKALRRFKKQVQASGVLEELRDRARYVKPTTARKLELNAAKNRWRKKLADQTLPPKLY